MIGLEKPSLNMSTVILQALLSSQYVLATKVRNFHWNVKGPQFMMYHELFGKLYTELNDQADEIAERIRQVNGTPNGTLKSLLADSFLKEAETAPNAQTMVKDLIDDYDRMVVEMRISIPKAEEAKDFGTMDLITKWMEVHEKHLYFLRSHVG